MEISFWKGHAWDLISSSSDSEELLLKLCLDAPCRAFVPENNDFLIFWTYAFSKSMHFLKFGVFSKRRLPRPNHYAHDVRSEILSRTPVSILKYLWPRPQNLRKTSNDSFLAWMSTWISKWRRRHPNNSPHLVRPLGRGEPLTSIYTHYVTSLSFYW